MKRTFADVGMRSNNLQDKGFKPNQTDIKLKKIVSLKRGVRLPLTSYARSDKLVQRQARAVLLETHRRASGEKYITVSGLGEIL